MRKVLVFDLTPAAVSVGEYIERELPVEVKKVVDSDCFSVEEVARKMATYVGEMDAIVIANPLLTAKCKAYLERCFPAQKFIFFGADLPKIIAENRKVLILTPKKLRATDYYQMLKAKCQEQEVRELDCEKWIDMVNSCFLQWPEIINKELKGLTGARLIINSAELMAVYDELSKVIDWRVNLIDLRIGIVDSLKQFFAVKEIRGSVCFEKKELSRGRVDFERRIPEKLAREVMEGQDRYVGVDYSVRF